MAKAVNGNGIFWKILMWAAGALVAIGVAWATLGNNITNNKMRIDKIEPQVESNKEQCQEFRYKIDRLDEKLTEQATVQQQVLVMQRQILEEVRKP